MSPPIWQDSHGRLYQGDVRALDETPQGGGALVRFRSAELRVQLLHMHNRVRGHRLSLSEPNMSPSWRMSGTCGLNLQGQFCLMPLEDEIGQARREQWQGNALRELDTPTCLAAVVSGREKLRGHTKPPTDRVERLSRSERERESQGKAWSRTIARNVTLALHTALAINQARDIGQLRCGQLRYVHISIVARGRSIER